MRLHKTLFPVLFAGLLTAFLTGCGGGSDDTAWRPETSGERIPIPPEIQEFFDTKVALPTTVHEDLEAGRISQEDVDRRIEAGEFPRLFTFATIDDLPEGLAWEDGMDLPEFGSPDAQKGGIWYTSMQDYPRTLRIVGPDASGTFRPYLLDHVTLQLGRRHPNLTTIDENGYPYYAELAQEWSIDKENRTLYVRLRPEARWSDGVPINAEDYAYSLYFYTSPHLQAPWYPNYYNRNFSNFIVYDDYTFSFQIPEAKPDMTTRMLDFRPMPMHHYGVLDDTYVDKFQWEFQPTTGPYIIRPQDVNKGRFIRLTRNQDWWAKDLKFQRYRFNPDILHFSVIRDSEKAIEAFKKGELDAFSLVITPWWHDKVPDNDPLVRDGYIHKHLFYNDLPRPTFALWMNHAQPPLNNRDIRVGLQHALNWDRVINEYHRGDYVRKRTSTDGFGVFTHPTLQARTYDVERALEYFARAGYTQRNARGILTNARGETLSVSLTSPYQSASDELTILQEEARKAGVDLNLDLLDLTAGFKKLNEKNHQLAFAAYSTSPTEMYPRFWEYYHSFNAYDRAFLPDGSVNPDRRPKPNTNNIQSFADPRMDALIEEYRASSDAETMQRISHTLQEIVHESGSYNPAYVRPFLRMGSWRWVHWPEDFNVRIASQSDEYFLFWIDEEQKRETLAARRRGETFEPVVRTYNQYDAYGTSDDSAD